MANIVQDDQLSLAINDIVLRVNNITIHTYHFLKLFLLYRFDIVNSHRCWSQFDFVDKEFICNIFRIITVKIDKRGGTVTEKNKIRHNTLLEFYNTYYKSTMPANEVLIYDKLKCVLAYSAIEMITNINNNISEHFCNHLKRYLKIHFAIKEQIVQIKCNFRDKAQQKSQISAIWSMFDSIYDDIIYYTRAIKTQSHVEYITSMRQFLFANILFVPNPTLVDKHLNYYLKADPQKYMYSMIALGKLFERLPKVDNQEIRLFNILPLRTEVTPKMITFDTLALVSNFHTGKKKEAETDCTKNKYPYWNEVFNMKNRVFRKDKWLYKFAKGYMGWHKQDTALFRYMLKTDGVSCCLLFSPCDANGNEVMSTQESQKVANSDMNYIEKVLHTPEAACLQGLRGVCIDPGKQDLIYCGSYNAANELETFRYTQAQRKFEMKTKEFQDKRERIKPERVQNIENI